jgi:hypothetical protein
MRPAHLLAAAVAAAFATQTSAQAPKDQAGISRASESCKGTLDLLRVLHADRGNLHADDRGYRLDSHRAIGVKPPQDRQSVS